MLLACLTLAVVSAAPAIAGTKGKARYSVPVEKLDAALACAHIDGDTFRFGAVTGAGRSEPVLLVHGTGATREQNWEWNYWTALLDEGFEVCWVQLPNGSVGDIQISSEYVARAVEMMHKHSGEKVDVLGHSQGGLQPRWAIKWFPSGDKVDDYVGLASPNHGTYMAGYGPLAGPCFESCWQMRAGSNFLAALNADDETPGATSYTSIYTATDELVQPTGTQALEGASNILLQDICPGRPVDHVGIAGDYVTWELVLNAFTQTGPADPAELSADACTQTVIPGMDAPSPSEPADYSEGKITSEEPPLMPYAR